MYPTKLPWQLCKLLLVPSDVGQADTLGKSQKLPSSGLILLRGL
jgi:hypothetical protein